MIFYPACVLETKHRYPKLFIPKGTHALESYYFWVGWLPFFRREEDRIKHFMLDSGAFSAFATGGKVSPGVRLNVQSYINFIHAHWKFVKRATIIAFDTIIPSDPIFSARKSYKDWLTMKKEGINAVPVYHVREERRVLQKYIEEGGCPYVGLGGVGKAIRKRGGKAYTRFLRTLDWLGTKHPKVKIHLFGAMVGVDVFSRFPFYSADSATWAVSIVRFDDIFTGVDKNRLTVTMTNIEKARKGHLPSKLLFFRLGGTARTLMNRKAQFDRTRLLEENLKWSMKLGHTITDYWKKREVTW